jgi:hypothetical protein
MKSTVAFLISFCSAAILAAASNVANATGPVGGSNSPGDPSLLTTFMAPVAPPQQAPIAAEDPKSREVPGDKPGSNPSKGG